MLSFLFNKTKNKVYIDFATKLTKLFAEIKKLYCYDEITEERKAYLSEKINKYGYLPFSHNRALEELTDAETLFCVELKCRLNKTLSDNGFVFDEKTLHPAVRAGYSDSSWMKKEQHNIKLINLAALGDGNKSAEVGRFIDWLRQIVTLPAGNKSKNILATTIYLIPFHPREFGCAYLPTSSEVSSTLSDKLIEVNLQLDAKDQVKLFVKLAQLCGHSVIYDILPQTGRFSKAVLANPFIARWFDINYLLAEYKKHVDVVSEKLKLKYVADDVDTVVRIYKSNFYGGSEELKEHFQDIYDEINVLMLDFRKKMSNKVMSKSSQQNVVSRVKEIVALTNKIPVSSVNSEESIAYQVDTIQNLISAGLWPAPGGAWCSCGVPVFIKMSECGSYPIFKHFDVKNNDVTHFANLDCQTPYYFVYLENGQYNKKVVEYFIDYMKKLQSDYGFDGFRVDHIDHVVDEFSQKNGIPISYRAPAKVLGELNAQMKAIVPHFAILAEYMLWDNFYKEYHIDMNFDILWGNDIISQSDKTPAAIIDDNQTLSAYNSKLQKNVPPLSILKTYNNQDGEFKEIDRYPAQLGEQGALFKWFKYKFLPGGKNANRPVMFVDGDESFTQVGMEKTIGAEISLKRNNNEEFYRKFIAINDFALNSKLTNGGEAQILKEDDDGFVAWMITKDPLKEALLVVANQVSPTEKKVTSKGTEIVYGENVVSKLINLPCDNHIVSQYTFSSREKKFVEKEFARKNSIRFKEIKPAEFFVYKVIKGNLN